TRRSSSATPSVRCAPAPGRRPAPAGSPCSCQHRQRGQQLYTASGTAFDLQAAADRFETLAHSRQTIADAQRAATTTIVADIESDTAVLAREHDPDVLGVAMARGIGQ